MTEVIQKFLQKYKETPETPELRRTLSLEQAQKDMRFIEFLQLEAGSILRKEGLPCGLRNIGNSTHWFKQPATLTPLFNYYIVSTVQGTHSYKETLTTELQNLFATMLMTRFSYADPSYVFMALNRINTDKIHLGDHYDFSEYFSLNLDILEKILAKSKDFQGKDKLLQKVFYGTLAQQFNDGKEVNKHEVKFGVVSLDVKYQTFQKAFNGFLNYSVEGYKTSSGLVVPAQVQSRISNFPGLLICSVNRVSFIDGNLFKNNQHFAYPEVFQFDLMTGAPVSLLTKEETDLQAQIAELQGLIQKKEHKAYLQSLKITLGFMQKQTSTDYLNSALQQKQFFNVFGVRVGQDTHSKFIQELKAYISVLQQQQSLLQRKMEQLQQLRMKKSMNTDRKQYRLMAVLIHQGVASMGHYYTYIYNEATRKWHKFNDKQVTEVTADEVKLSALGQLREEMNVCGLVYKSSQIRCDPKTQPTSIVPHLRGFVVNNDEYLAENIDRVRLQRILKNYAEVARQETQLSVQSYRQDILCFTRFFSSYSFYFIGCNQFKTAQYWRMLGLLFQSNFLEDARKSQLSKIQISIPQVKFDVPQQFNILSNTIKSALLEEQRNNIEKSLYYLFDRKALSMKIPCMRGMYERVMLLFLLKACFYIDLRIQKQQNFANLYQIIKYLLSIITPCAYTQQITDNLKYSVTSARMKYTSQSKSIKIPNTLWQNTLPVDNVDMEKYFQFRFKLWLEFFKQIGSGALIRQQDRIQRQALQLVQYAP